MSPKVRVEWAVGIAEGLRDASFECDFGSDAYRYFRWEMRQYALCVRSGSMVRHDAPGALRIAAFSRLRIAAFKQRRCL